MAWNRSKGRLVRPGDPLPAAPAAWSRHGATAPTGLAAAHRRVAAVAGEMALKLARGTAAVVPAEDAGRWAAELRAVAEAMAGHQCRRSADAVRPR
jgi:hypothetical protein